MPHFSPLEATNDLKKILKTAFDSDLAVSGSWGYAQDDATLIEAKDMSLVQTGHIFASMRAYIEMNMTLSEENRYGSINLNEKTREEHTIENQKYHKVTYEVTAMKESSYKQFIKEYKEEYGKTSFDLNQHFKRRKEATLHREVIHWFKII